MPMPIAISISDAAQPRAPSSRAAASACVKGSVMPAMLASAQAVPAAQQAWASMLMGALAV
ncbi:MAG: hypothetical protein O9313_03660 [Acetobacteraceae bacterium]|jgi:hypothetical protein|nr:hypothetical protein [Acetobacteraceae bacterium]